MTVDRAYSLTSSDVAVPEVWRKALLALVPAAAAAVGDGEGDDDALDDAGIMPPSPVSKSPSGLEALVQDGRRASAVSDGDGYVGAQTRQACVALLECGDDGDFVVRLDKERSLLIMHIKDGSQIANIVVSRSEREGGGERGYCITSKNVFDTLEDLIDHLRAKPPKNAEGKKLWLMSPLGGMPEPEPEPEPEPQTEPEPAPPERRGSGSFEGFGSDDDSEIEI